MISIHSHSTSMKYCVHEHLAANVRSRAVDPDSETRTHKFITSAWSHEFVQLKFPPVRVPYKLIQVLSFIFGYISQYTYIILLQADGVVPREDPT